LSFLPLNNEVLRLIFSRHLILTRSVEEKSDK